MKEHQKIILVGDGAVGSSYAFACVNLNIGQELGIIDIDKDRTIGDAIDLSHAVPFSSPKKIYSANYSDCHDADLIVITAGSAQKPGETRLDLVSRNIRIMKGIVTDVMASGFDGIFLIASNPVDLMTYAAYKFSGLPKERVIGSGTSLDTARFRMSIADYLKVDARNVHGYILGEHGDTEFPTWSHTRVGGLPITDWINEEEKGAMETIFISVRDAAYEIIDKKGATYYGIAAALARITKAILDNENAILPLSVYLEGHYGLNGIYIGAPAVVNRKGIRQIIEMKLSEKEQEQMKMSAETLQKVLNDAMKEVE
ncbi:L-lactate dehydrogenase [Listeria sp. PSOL-1]|uniref:L-lactate dehydrogenase n=1 Tax=Listeria sp. PSOL-1 TaxID=1844999 RepID=UPI0013D41A75|nr:L-lactate dehydrogenase [Listeria sp. PSOL-1]